MDSCSFDPCFNPVKSDDLCSYHFAQRTYGAPLALEPMAQARWIMNVAAGNHGDSDDHGCIIWPFRSSYLGYGKTARIIDGRATGSLASRWLCEVVHGNPPNDGKDWVAAHDCGRGHLGCVTPEHLTWKTPEGNSADKVQHDTLPYGERHAHATLTVDKVRAILLDDRIAEEIGKEYGVADRTVTKIKRGQSWRRVYDQVVAEGLEVKQFRSGGQRGAGNSATKLTSEDVRAIRASSEASMVLAKKYKISYSSVRTIIRGDSWQFE